MSLARAWTRQLCGASGAALLVPGAIVGALLVLGLAGGFGQLGALSQAFAGPAVPASARVAHGRGAVGGAARALPVAAAVTAPGAAGIAGGGVGGGVGGAAPGGAVGQTGGPGNGTGGQGGGLSGRGGIGGGGGRLGGGTGGTGRSGGAGTGGSGSGGSGSGTGASLVNGVVNLGTSITGKVPGPVGTLATGLLQSLGKSVDGILPQSSGR